MDYWISSMPQAKDYKVMLNGKTEPPTCVEAQSSPDKGVNGWVKRRWLVGLEMRERKFYGNVHIVRVK